MPWCSAPAPKEAPAKPMNPTAPKAILDPRDLDVAARANHSSAKDATTFPVTWAVIIVS